MTHGKKQLIPSRFTIRTHACPLYSLPRPAPPGDPLYERVALRALYALWERQSSLGLFGNHINVKTGKWTAMDAGIGTSLDRLVLQAGHVLFILLICVALLVSGN